MEIRKKTWPELFEAVLSGRKKFDLRLDDFEINEGDYLILEEWDPKTKSYTGRKLKRKVSFVLHTKEIDFWKKEEVNEEGFLVMSLD